MIQILERMLTLAEFWHRPETKPANEYLNGRMILKPMPQGKHRRVQGELGAAVDEVFGWLME